MKFNQLVEKHFKLHLKKKSQKTQIMQMQQLQFWNKHFGHKNISRIKAKHVREVWLEIELGKNTKNCYLAALSSCFSTAVKELDLLEANPVSKITREIPDNIAPRFLKKSERENLLIAAKESSNQYLYLIILLALTTGARKEEIVGLRWEQVDLDKRVITLYNTKNKKIRSLAIAEGETYNVLFQHFSESRSAFLFPGRSGKDSIDIEYPFEQAINRAQIENFTFHHLRHTFASEMAMAGKTLLQIAEMLGHSNTHHVRIYAHFCNEHKNKLSNEVAQRMGLN